MTPRCIRFCMATGPDEYGVMYRLMVSRRLQSFTARRAIRTSPGITSANTGGRTRASRPVVRLRDAIGSVDHVETLWRASTRIAEHGATCAYSPASRESKCNQRANSYN